MHTLKRSRLLLMLFFSCVYMARGQGVLTYSQDAERIFKQGVTQFSEERFEEAVVSFDRVIKAYSLNQRTTAAHLMKTKALLGLNNAAEAVRTLKHFLVEFPTSSYVADAHYTLGLAFVKLSRYDEAMRDFLDAWRGVGTSSQQRRLASDIMDAMEQLIDEDFQVVMVRRLANENPTGREGAFFLMKLAEKEIARGNLTAGGRVLDTLELRYPDHQYFARAAALRKQTQQRTSVKLGALLPVMKKGGFSQTREVGTDIYDGVQFAIEEYGRDPATTVRVSLQLIDTERDPLIASRGVQDLTNDNDVLAIIGPVFSGTTSAAVGVANLRGVPLVTPTANTNGIAAVGPYIFQANPDYDVRGRAMARYAIEVMGMKTVAVLAPIDSYGKEMAEAFIDEATRLHALVVATEWYQRGTSDLKMQLSNIRRIAMTEAAEPMLSFAGKLNQSDLAKLMMLGVSPKTIDSLIEKGSVVGARTMLGFDAKRKIDSLGITVQYAEPKVDSLEYPVLSINGMYAPISSSDEIGIVSSQLVYFNFQTQMLGSGEWNNFAELNANKRYCEGVIFESDNYVDPDNSKYTDWMNRFFERFRKRPSKNTLYGYDTATLLLSLIRAGNSTREELRQALSEVREYQGLHSKIGFSFRRVNPWVLILQYSSDQIRRIGEINVAQP